MTEKYKKLEKDECGKRIKALRQDTGHEAQDVINAVVNFFSDDKIKVTSNFQIFEEVAK